MRILVAGTLTEKYGAYAWHSRAPKVQPLATGPQNFAGYSPDGSQIFKASSTSPNTKLSDQHPDTIKDPGLLALMCVPYKKIKIRFVKVLV